jgi:hypothetical protein
MTLSSFVEMIFFLCPGIHGGSIFPALKMRQLNYSVADLCGSVLTLLSSQVKKMGGSGSLGGGIVGGSTMLNPAPSRGGYLNVQKQFRVRFFSWLRFFALIVQFCA